MSRFLLLHRLFRRLHQRNRLVGVSPASGVTLLHHHVLLEIDADPALTVSALAALLGIDQGYCSRVCAGLVADGALAAGTGADRRRKSFKLTPAGRRLIKKIDLAANHRYDTFAAPLSATARLDLERLFRAVADGLGHPPAPTRAEEPSFRTEQRRVTRCFGLLGERVFGSDLSSAAWHILSEIVNAPVPVTPGDLALALTLPPTTVSSLVARLVREKLIAKRRAATDGRSVELEGTARGKTVVREIESHAADDLARALRSVPESQLDRWIDVLTRFVGQRDPDELLLPSTIAVRRAASLDERRLLRSEVVERFVKRRQAHALPERLIGEDGEVWAVSLDGKLIAVVEAGSGAARDGGKNIRSELCLPGCSRAIAFAVREKIRRGELD